MVQLGYKRSFWTDCISSLTIVNAFPQKHDIKCNHLSRDWLVIHSKITRDIKALITRLLLSSFDILDNNHCTFCLISNMLTISLLTMMLIMVRWSLIILKTEKCLWIWRQNQNSSVKHRTKNKKRNTFWNQCRCMTVTFKTSKYHQFCLKSCIEFRVNHS